MNKICTKCKNEKPIVEFFNNSAQPDGLSCWCKECNSEYSKTPVAKKTKAKCESTPSARQTREKYGRTLEGVFVTKKSSAKTRGIDFSLTFEEFVTIINRDLVCEYCGRPIEECIDLNVFVKNYEGNDVRLLKLAKNISNKMYNGKSFQLDRKDSLLGYTFENCVLACAICNVAKGWFLSHSVFKKVAKEAMDELMNTCVSAGYEVENG